MKARALLLFPVILGPLVGCDGGDETALPSSIYVLEAPPADMAAEPLLPFALEHEADIVALGRMGEPFELEDMHLVRLQIDRELKGSMDAMAVATADEVPWLGCIPPDEPIVASELYAPGTRVLIHLDEDEYGWSLIALSALGPENAQNVRSVVRFLAVHRAADAHNPAHEYHKVLAEDAGGLDEPAYWALAHQPSPEAGNAILSILNRISALKTALDPETLAVLIRGADLLGRQRAASGVKPVVAVLPKLDRTDRMILYPHLGAMCEKADPIQVGKARAILLKDLDDSSLMQIGPHFRIVVNTFGLIADSDAVDRLLLEQERHRQTRVGHYVVAAVREAYRVAGPKERRRIIDAWLEIMSSLTPERPSADEQAFVLEVMFALLSISSDGDIRDLLETALDDGVDDWYHDELSAALDRE